MGATPLEAFFVLHMPLQRNYFHYTQTLTVKADAEKCALFT